MDESFAKRYVVTKLNIVIGSLAVVLAIFWHVRFNTEIEAMLEANNIAVQINDPDHRFKMIPTQLSILEVDQFESAKIFIKKQDGTEAIFNLSRKANDFQTSIRFLRAQGSFGANLDPSFGKKDISFGYRGNTVTCSLKNAETANSFQAVQKVYVTLSLGDYQAYKINSEKSLLFQERNALVKMEVDFKSTLLIRAICSDSSMIQNFRGVDLKKLEIRHRVGEQIILPSEIKGQIRYLNYPQIKEKSMYKSYELVAHNLKNSYIGRFTFSQGNGFKVHAKIYGKPYVIRFDERKEPLHLSMLNALVSSPSWIFIFSALFSILGINAGKSDLSEWAKKRKMKKAIK